MKHDHQSMCGLHIHVHMYLAEDLLYQTSSVPTQHLPLSHSLVLARRPQTEMVPFTQEEINAGIRSSLGVYHLIGELNDECIFKSQVSGGALDMSPDQTAFICKVKGVFYLLHHPQFDDVEVAWDKLNVVAKFSNDLRKVFIPWDSQVPSESLTCWDIQEYLWLLSQWLEKKSL